MLVIDDFTDPARVSTIGTRWRGISDRVMGGISEARVAHERVDGSLCLRLHGDVRLDNNGGFIQAALDLSPGGGVLDASAYSAVRIQVRGNDEQYNVHLRTPDNVRPWQSYRSSFRAIDGWQTIELPFESFEPYRLQARLDVTRLRRIALVAIGRAFFADLFVRSIALCSPRPVR